MQYNAQVPACVIDSHNIDAFTGMSRHLFRLDKLSSGVMAGARASCFSLQAVFIGAVSKARTAGCILISIVSGPECGKIFEFVWQVRNDGIGMILSLLSVYSWGYFCGYSNGSNYRNTGELLTVPLLYHFRPLRF